MHLYQRVPKASAVAVRRLASEKLMTYHGKYELGTG